MDFGLAAANPKTYFRNFRILSHSEIHADKWAWHTASNAI